MAQFGQPFSDIQLVNVGGGSYRSIDEAVASDVDFVWNDDNTVGIMEFGLSDSDLDPLVDPGVDTGFIFRGRVSKCDGGVPNDNTGNACELSIQLMQGATQIELIWNVVSVGLWEDISIALTPALIANITDFSDLRFLFTTTGSGGSPANRRGVAISWAQLELPDAPEPSGERRFFSVT